MHISYRETRGGLDLLSTFARLREGLRNAVQGRDEVIDLILVALLADGHVLLEDHPGSGKTTLARTLGSLIETRSPARTESNSQPRAGEEELPSFRRIQFTPDLMPSDILGVSIFDRRPAQDGRYSRTGERGLYGFRAAAWTWLYNPHSRY